MKLCRNKKTGAVFVWNDLLAGDPDIELIQDSETTYSQEVKDESAEEGLRGQEAQAEEIIQKISRKGRS